MSEIFVNKGIENIDGNLGSAQFRAPLDLYYGGMGATLRSSEQADFDFFAKLRAAKPDGYLVGMGVGGIFGLIEGFKPNPVGIVAADVNPHVVVAGRVMVDTARDSETSNEFVNKLFDMPKDEYEKKAKQVARQNKDLARGVLLWDHGQGARIDTPMFARDFYRDSDRDSQLVNVPRIVEKQFPVLKQLVEWRNLAVCYADITNPDFLRALSHLPKFNEFTNVVYLSNAQDLAREAEFVKFKQLKALENGDKQPIYVSCFSEDGLYWKLSRQI